MQLTETAPSAIRDTRVEIRLRNGRSLLVGRGFDTEHVRAIAGAGGDGVVIELPSLQAMDRAQETRIWLASEATDMRCGKRLEQGKFKLPRPREGGRGVELRTSELAMILDGIDVSKLKRVRRYERALCAVEKKNLANTESARKY